MRRAVFCHGQLHRFEPGRRAFSRGALAACLPRWCSPLVFSWPQAFASSSRSRDLYVIGIKFRKLAESKAKMQAGPGKSSGASRKNPCKTRTYVIILMMFIKYDACQNKQSIV
jgi:hypothetical protein